MNFSWPDSILMRQRCRQWFPLITQQLRIRHLYQVLAYNVAVDKQGGLYYTLHLTSMSAPFYTSERINNVNPKWSELLLPNNINLSATAFVLRIWKAQENSMDSIVVTWGINLSGLVYLGSKLSDIPPTSFTENTVILQLHGGYFTSRYSIKTAAAPFHENLNIINNSDGSKIFRKNKIKIPMQEIKSSYNIDKLRKLHSLQIRIKNGSSDVQNLRDRISAKCALCDDRPIETPTRIEPPATSPNSNIRYAPQLLTMNCLNRMLQEKPTKVQMQEIIKIKKQIEIYKFKTKMLSQEKDRKSAQLRQLQTKYSTLSEENEDRESQLMENYRKLSKSIERLKDTKKELFQQREELIHISSQLHNRRRQLVSQLLTIYPINETTPGRFIINNVYLPNADLLTDCSDSGLSVALGYVAHILTMCASFLQVPLRYPIFHMGSRSHITDNISPQLLDKEREFPLYTKGKDRMQFNYAVYLINKNIAQLRCLYGLNTPELKSTLLNLLTFLQGKDYKTHLTKSHEHLNDAHCYRKENETDSVDLNKIDGCKSDSLENVHKNSISPAHNFGSTPNISQPILDMLKHESCIEKSNGNPKKPIKKKSKPSESGPGLSEILAIPEAFLNKQMSASAFKNYAVQNMVNKANVDYKTENSSASSSRSNRSKKGSDFVCNSIKNTNDHEPIEEGTDLLDTSLHENNCIIETCDTKLLKHKSRSVGSYTDESLLELKNNLEVGSDPLLNISSDVSNDGINIGLPGSSEERQQEFLQKWLDSGPALVCSEQSLYPDEVLGTVADVSRPERQLTSRTDALLNTTSFNLVKPKF